MSFGPRGGGGGGGGTPETVGKIAAFMAIPAGWLECDGSFLDQGAYPGLVLIITTLGNPWGVQQLPDLRGRAIIGAGTGAGLTERSIGDVIGEETHALTGDELPPHVHSTASGTSEFITSDALEGVASGSDLNLGLSQESTTGSQTSGYYGPTSHNNMQPSTVLRWCVKAG